MDGAVKRHGLRLVKLVVRFCLGDNRELTDHEQTHFRNAARSAHTDLMFAQRSIGSNRRLGGEMLRIDHLKASYC